MWNRANHLRSCSCNCPNWLDSVRMSVANFVVKFLGSMTMRLTMNWRHRLAGNIELLDWMFWLLHDQPKMYLRNDGHAIRKSRSWLFLSRQYDTTLLPDQSILTARLVNFPKYHWLVHHFLELRAPKLDQLDHQFLSIEMLSPVMKNEKKNNYFFIMLFTIPFNKYMAHGLFLNNGIKYNFNIY